MLKQIAGMISRRIGTLIAGYLVAKGADADLVNQVVIGVGGVVAITADLVLSSIEKRRR